MPSNAASPAAGAELPLMRHAPPGPESVRWLQRFARVAAPMGPRAAWVEPQAGAGGTIVYQAGHGSNLIDADGNRYVDLAAGFGSLLLGHDPEGVRLALARQSEQLLQSLGDLHPSTVKIELLERLAALVGGDARALLGQSGADALSAALKSAALYTGRPGVLAFQGAYHGLSHGPLASCGLRESYREPFAAQLNPHARFIEYPLDEAACERALEQARRELARGDVGAVLFEPILGRGGCVVPPARFAPALAELCRAAGCLLVADEIWTGLGRAGHWLYSRAQGVEADLICLGKGLGGGVPISACLGRAQLLQAWSRAEEVVHTSTFAGAPLACAAGLATLELLERGQLVARAARVGAAWQSALEAAVSGCSLRVGVRGAGLMQGLDLSERPGAALELCRRLLACGYVTSLGGGRRECLVLTPALDVSESLLDAFCAALSETLREVAA
ncbi:MAG TPA: aspartate aminotransferase family protein [Polyangiaceae bacterium]|nr:aspartate aminotransferase family protein [Polyangiaceae bacterium]